MAVVREMLRMVKPGGYAIAYEGRLRRRAERSAVPGPRQHQQDLAARLPESVGRPALVGWFRQGGATTLQAGALSLLEHEGTGFRRIYRLTAEATAPVAVARGVMDETEARDMVAGLIALEEDPQAVVVKFPDMWVIAQR
jgi:hypothetical protein